MESCDVSVIITTRNEEAHLEDCLRSIKNQDYPHDKTEIIVVDNNSTDRTKEIALQYTDKVYNFGPERSAQRNYGVKEAQGKYILYLDADMVLSESLIRECIEICEHEGHVALYIPEEIIGEGFWIKVRNFERSFYDGTVIDCVRFVLRDSFIEIRGFDESLTGPEDWDFDRRIREKGNTGITKNYLFHNEGVFDIGAYCQKKSYYSQSFERYIKKWGKNDAVIKKQFGFYYRFVSVYPERKGYREFFRHPVLALGMYFLRFLVGIIYIKNKLHDGS